MDFVKYVDAMGHKVGWVWDNSKENRVRPPVPEILEKSVADDPAEALEALGELRAFVETATIGAVHDARFAGFSWERIGKYLGRTKQAVWLKYAGYDPQGGRIDASE